MKLSLSLFMICALSLSAVSGCALDDASPDELSADSSDEALSETTQEINNGWHTVCWPAVRFYKEDDIFGTQTKVFHTGHRWYQVRQRWTSMVGIYDNGTYWYSYGHDNHGNIGFIRVAALSC